MNDDEDNVSEGESVNVLFRLVLESSGPSSRRISPKYFSVSLSAVSWETPAKATTILSGLKKAFRYFSTTSLLIYGRRSCGHNSGFPRVLSLYAATLTSSGNISSGFAHISPISYSAVSSC